MHVQVRARVCVCVRACLSTCIWYVSFFFVLNRQLSQPSGCAHVAYRARVPFLDFLGCRPEIYGV